MNSIKSYIKNIHYKKYVKYGLVITTIILAYFALLLLRPFYYNEELSLTFGENDLKKGSPRFYLNEKNIANGNISPQAIYANMSYREFYGMQSSFVIKPKIYPPDMQKLSLSLDFLGKGADIYAEIPCNECINKLPIVPLYLKDLETFEQKIQIIKGKYPVFFYSKKKTINNPQISKSAEDWIIKNIPIGTPVTITKGMLNQLDFNKIVNPKLDFDSKKKTNLNFAIQPNQIFFIQSSTDLKIDLIKYNYNKYKGSDAFEFQVLDLNNRLITKKSFFDDGITNANKKETGQKLNFNFTLPKKGIYKIKILSENNKDFEIRKFSINTNKIVSTEIRTQKGQTFYTFLNEDGQISIGGKQQDKKNITISNLDNSKVIKINQLKNLREDIALDKGGYKINFKDTANLHSGYYAPSKDSFFLPYFVELRSGGNYKNVLTQLNLKKNENGQLRGVNYFSKNSLKSLANEKNLQEIRMNLNLDFPHNLEKGKIIDQLVKNSYGYVTDFCGLTIYSAITNIFKTQDEVKCDKKNIINELKKIIPDNENVIFYTDVVGGENFYNIKGVNNYRYGSKNEFKTNIRGNAEFAFYIKGDLDVDIFKYDTNAYMGSDEVAIKIKDHNRKIIYEDVIDDDGIASASRYESDVIDKKIKIKNLNGVYFLELEDKTGKNEDYKIEKIKINTNKFLLLNGAIFYQPTNLFINNENSKKLTFYFWHNNPQDILINGKKALSFTSKHNNKMTSHYIDKGLHSIQTTGTQIDIWNSNFFFDKNSGFHFPFIQYNNYIVTDNLGDFNFDLYKFGLLF